MARHERSTAKNGECCRRPFLVPESFSHAVKPADDHRRCRRGNGVPRSNADRLHDAMFRFYLGQYCASLRRALPVVDGHAASFLAVRAMPADGPRGGRRDRGASISQTNPLAAVLRLDLSHFRHLTHTLFLKQQTACPVLFPIGCPRSQNDRATKRQNSKIQSRNDPRVHRTP